MILKRSLPIVIEETINETYETTTETTYYEEYHNLNNTEMKKKILICGNNYEISANNCVAVAKSIQKHIDKICNDPNNPNERLVDLSLDLLEKSNGEELDITFTFDRNNLFAKNGTNPDFINDSDGMLIMGMGGHYSPPLLWEYVQPIGSTNRYNIPISEFVYAYAESVKESGATELKGIRIESSKTKFVLEISI